MSKEKEKLKKLKIKHFDLSGFLLKAVFDLISHDFESALVYFRFNYVLASKAFQCLKKESFDVSSLWNSHNDTGFNFFF